MPRPSCFCSKIPKKQRFEGHQAIIVSVLVFQLNGSRSCCCILALRKVWLLKVSQYTFFAKIFCLYIFIELLCTLDLPSGYYFLQPCEK